MHKIKVSVCMALYNTKEAYLREAVASILNQTFKDFELLIVNDSPQNTELDKVIESFDDSRIKYFRNETNLGISGARNLLLDRAEGEYIAVMDHDDIALPERLAEEVKFLDSHPEIGVVGCCYQRIPDGKIKKLQLNDTEIKHRFFTRCAILHPSAMVRKSVLEENKIRYESEFTPSEDYALWCRLAPHTCFANLPQILFCYRSYSGNTSKSQNAKMKNASARIVEFYKRDNPELWKKAQEDLEMVYQVLLFSFLPLLSVEVCGKRRVYKLFGFLPVMKREEKRC